MHRLATAKNLTPDEQKTRHALAIIAGTIETNKSQLAIPAGTIPTVSVASTEDTAPALTVPAAPVHPAPAAAPPEDARARAGHGSHSYSSQAACRPPRSGSRQGRHPGPRAWCRRPAPPIGGLLVTRRARSETPALRVGGCSRRFSAGNCFVSARGPYPSISSSLGRWVRTSWPVSVTSTSSSMRMPPQFSM